MILEYSFDFSLPINCTYESILDICRQPNNHSKRKNIRKENIDENLFITLCGTYITEEMTNNLHSNSKLTSVLNDILYKAAKDSCKMYKKQDYQSQTNGEDYQSMKNELQEEDRYKWRSVIDCKDSKKLWNHINWRGDLHRDTVKLENHHNDFANVLKERSSCPIEQYDDIVTGIFNPVLDGKIMEDEIKVAAEKMNRNSQSNTGITMGILLLILNQIMYVLTPLYNNIFRGNFDKYPKNWTSAIQCISKKGKFNLSTFRGIALKDILAKLYDYILMLRIEKWLKIPDEQTAYQKGKGCIMHVFFVRCLISIVVKTGKPIFIGVTDFTAAFDTISRRKLFTKLVNLGIGMFMLNALKEMYSDTLAYVSIDGEYSDIFELNAGVLQGAATSALLFIAYTSDIITVFNTQFACEMFIHTYHLLLHADDSLILATTKRLLVEKYLAMEKYSLENMLYLQTKKCGFLVINSNQKEPIALQKGNINHLDEITYLGSMISSRGNVTQDVILEINSNKKHFNKFFAFISKNYNAPMTVKEKVLESCLRSSILYNCEAWGDANISKLETKYTSALKYMLGVRNQTCNEFPYIELGITTLKSMVVKRQYRFYKNIVCERDWPMLRHIVRQSKDNNTGFVKYYDKLLERYACEEDIIVEAMQKIRYDITEKAQNGKSKYIAYIKNNPNLKRSQIYDQSIQTSKLQKVTQIRTISHSLEIEVGRHGRYRKSVEDRLCHCSEIETEEHFLLNCHSYIHIRQKYNVTDNYTLSTILEKIDVADYISELYKVRLLYK